MSIAHAVEHADQNARCLSRRAFCVSENFSCTRGLPLAPRAAGASSRRGARALILTEHLPMPKTARGLNYIANDYRPPWLPGPPDCRSCSTTAIGTNLAVWSAWLPIVAARHPVVRSTCAALVDPCSAAHTSGRWTTRRRPDRGRGHDGASKVHLVGEFDRWHDRARRRAEGA